MSNLELGLREPAWSTVQAICRALGVSCSAFEGTITPVEHAAPSPRGRPHKKAPGAPATALPAAETVEASSETPAASPGAKKGRGKGKK